MNNKKVTQAKWIEGNLKSAEIVIAAEKKLDRRTHSNSNNRAASKKKEINIFVGIFRFRHMAHKLSTY